MYVKCMIYDLDQMSRSRSNAVSIAVAFEVQVYQQHTHTHLVMNKYTMSSKHNKPSSNNINEANST